MSAPSTPWATAFKLFTLGYSVIPSGGGEKGKAPRVDWKPYQTVSPSEEQLREWERALRPTLWGIVTNANVGVIDADGPSNREELTREIGKEHHILTPGKGGHWYVDTTGHPFPTVAGILPSIDVRGVGGFVNIAGGAYVIRELPIPGDNLLPYDQLPERIRKALEGQKAAKPPITLPEVIPTGQRRDFLFRMGCALRNKGFSQAGIAAALKAENGRCDPPFSDAQIDDIAFYAALYPAGEIPQGPAAPPEVKTDGSTVTLADLLESYNKYLFLDDTGPVEMVLGGVVANHLAGDPVWLLIVGPPGWGKTEVLMSVVSTPHVHPVAVLTEASLLSGTPKKDAHGAKGGLLRELGEFGILLVKDFGSVLSLNKEIRGSILAALREVYDGSWTRYVGSDGGRALSWAGKAGLLGGATPAIDEHHAVMGILGERFAFYRLALGKDSRYAQASLSHIGHEEIMREELREKTASFFSGLDLTSLPLISEEERSKLVSLALFTVRCRSAIDRDPYGSREIRNIPGRESPTRLVKMLHKLLSGLLIVGVARNRAWELVQKTALDSMPSLRQKLILYMMKTDKEATYKTTELANALGYPTTTTRYCLEDLAAYGVVIRTSQGQGQADLWSLTVWSKAVYVSATATLHEIAGGLYKEFMNISTTISCKVGLLGVPEDDNADTDYILPSGRGLSVKKLLAEWLDLGAPAVPLNGHNKIDDLGAYLIQEGVDLAELEAAVNFLEGANA